MRTGFATRNVVVCQTDIASYSVAINCRMQFSVFVGDVRMDTGQAFQVAFMVSINIVTFLRTTMGSRGH